MIETKLVEKKEIVDGLEIKYMFKPATLDVEHLIVIFSGFGARSLFTYDFAGDSLKDIPSNILWIKDEFGGAPCYYLCKHRDFSIEEKVIKFIDKKINELSLCKDDVTILGASKGGSAALYFGIKYHFKNIISSAPQFDIGEYLKNPVTSKDVYKEMYDLERNDNDTFFNTLIYSLISKSEDYGENIYLIYSDCDEWQDYDKAIQLLKKTFKNVSQIKVDSNLVNTHSRITGYALSVIKSILLQNSYKFAPYFDYLKIGENAPKTITDNLKDSQLDLECYLERCLYTTKSLQLKILNLCRFSDETFSKARYYLYLESNVGVRYKFDLKKIQPSPIEQKDLEKKYFLYSYYDMRDSYFELINPLDLTSLKPLLYNLYIIKSEEQKEIKSTLTAVNEQVVYLNKDSELLGKIFSYRDDSVKLYLSSDISSKEPDIFKITKSLVNKSSFLYEGYFIKYGIICDDYSDLDFYLVFKNIKNNKSTRIRIAKGHDKRLNSLFCGECFISKAEFTSQGRKALVLGKDLHLLNGEYELYISMITLSQIFSYKFAHWNVINNIIVSESLYTEKEDVVSSLDLDELGFSDLKTMDERSIDMSILYYINTLRNQIPINYSKYIKIRQYLAESGKNALLDYLQFSLRNILQDDLCEVLK